MSYQATILKDSPIGFWPLDELYTSTYVVSTYDDPNTFYDEPAYYNSGSSYSGYALDKSGCGNHALYTEDFPLNDYLMPLVGGTMYATNISSTGYIRFTMDKNYYGKTEKGGFATKYTSDNNFTMEVWACPKASSTFEFPIFGDYATSVGIFYDNGNIAFKLNSERLDYTLPDINKSIHIVAVYDKTIMKLYIDGRLVNYKTLTDFKFINSILNIYIGPTEQITDSFLVDAPAIYRYSLSEEQIISHYNASKIINPIQIVNPDEGSLLTTMISNQDYIYSYSYPSNKPWQYFATDNLYINESGNYISLYKNDVEAPTSVVLNDYILIPQALPINASKVEWQGENGVSVRVSNDGSSWYNCTSGKSLPNYILGSGTFSSERGLYIEITLQSDLTSRYTPVLNYFKITFYNGKTIYAENSGDFISSMQSIGLSNNNNWDLDISGSHYNILSRDQNNGIRPQLPGFYLSTAKKTKTIEAFFTPESISNGYLFYATTESTPAYFSWAAGGAISKANVSAIYVNGVDRTSATNISSFIIAKELHHIVIVLSSYTSGDIWFNVKVSSGTWSNPLPRNLYQNIAIYNKAFTLTEAQAHYNLYIDNYLILADDSSLTLTDSGTIVYDRDWIAIKSR